MIQHNEKMTFSNPSSKRVRILRMRVAFVMFLSWLYLGCQTQLQARDGDEVISKNISYAVRLVGIVSNKLKGTVSVRKSTIKVRKYDSDQVSEFSNDIGRLAHIDPADVNLSKYFAANQDVVNVPSSHMESSGIRWVRDIYDANALGNGSNSPNTMLAFSVPFEVARSIYVCEVQVSRGPLSGHRDMYVFKVVNGEIEILGKMIVAVS